MENSNLIDNNKVLTFNKIQQIHSTYFLFEKEVENYCKRAQDADKNCKTMNNFSRSVTLFSKKVLMLLEMYLSI